jgi:hypothetical protein
MDLPDGPGYPAPSVGGLIRAKGLMTCSKPCA